MQFFLARVQGMILISKGKRLEVCEMKIKYLFSGINAEEGFSKEIVPFLQSDIKGEGLWKTMLIYIM